MLFTPNMTLKKFRTKSDESDELREQQQLVYNKTKSQLIKSGIKIDEANAYVNISSDGKTTMVGFPLTVGAWWKTSGLTPTIAIVSATNGHRRRRLYIGVEASAGGGVVLRSIRLGESGIAKPQQPVEEELSEQMNKVSDIIDGLHHKVRELMAPAVQPQYANAFFLKMARQQTRKYKLPYSYMGFADQAYLKLGAKTRGVVSKWDLLIAYSHGVLATKPAEFHPDKLMTGKIVLTKKKVEAQ